MKACVTEIGYENSSSRSFNKWQTATSVLPHGDLACHSLPAEMEQMRNCHSRSAMPLSDELTHCSVISSFLGSPSPPIQAWKLFTGCLVIQFFLFLARAKDGRGCGHARQHAEGQTVRVLRFSVEGKAQIGPASLFLPSVSR